MGDNSIAASLGGIDLTQFHQVFFEEAGDNLDQFEQQLVDMDVDAPADETLHAVFRCAHSVKGGAATFGFADVTALTHAMETLLDSLRRHELRPDAAMIDTLLASGDMLRALLQRHQEGDASMAPDTAPLVERLQAHARPDAASAAVASPAPAPAVVAAPIEPPASAHGEPAAAARDLEMTAGPLSHASLADELIDLFREVTGGGTLERVDALPYQAEGAVRFRLRTTATDGEVLDLCSFHVPREQIRLGPWPAAAGADVPGDALPVPAPAPLPEPTPLPESTATSAPAAVPVPAATAAAPVAAPTPAGPKRGASETLRVSVEKVDHLINLMGELVITQAMLAQRATRIDGEQRQHLVGGLADLERTTRDLQESVMAIRMIPMGEVFNRFPRMLRDLAARMGKQLQLHTVGEATELDKGMIEKITDPLTHLVRNSVDHGLELPAERVAAGKTPHGNLTMGARHEGGCIVIEVSDDGRGLDRERILAKARKQGMPLPEAPTDAEVWQLVFAPGFSTADAVTEVSGRGVGMDVVRRNILSLGGTVEIESHAGRGTSVRVRLPLTLAIMDGMSVAVDGELYVLPLASVVESFQSPRDVIRTMAQGQRVVKVRTEYLPVVALGHAMGALCEHAPGAPAMLVVVQAEGRRIALEVGELVGQQQVVVKNLESNYQKVAGVSGATIMGDGSVALILDVAALVRGLPGSSLAPSCRQPEEGPAPLADLPFDSLSA